MTRTVPDTSRPVLDVTSRGPVTDEERDVAHGMISAVMIHHRDGADHARIRLTASPGATVPALAQVNLRIYGAPARIQVAAPTTALAIAAAATRLERQIRRLSTAWEPWPWPDPERRPLGLPGEPAIGRVKTYRLHTAMPCQAVATLNAMDYDAHLFIDAETGEDAVVYRAGPTGLRLARQHTMRPPVNPVTPPLTVNSHKTPELTPSQAATRLADAWLPFLFFTDTDSHRGGLIYRRYDGTLGLITAAPNADRATMSPLTVRPVLGRETA